MRKVGGTVINFPVTPVISARMARNLHRKLAQQMLADSETLPVPIGAPTGSDGAVDLDVLADRLLDEFTVQNGVSPNRS